MCPGRKSYFKNRIKKMAANNTSLLLSEMWKFKRHTMSLHVSLNQSFIITHTYRVYILDGSFVKYVAKPKQIQRQPAMASTNFIVLDFGWVVRCLLPSLLFYACQRARDEQRKSIDTVCCSPVTFVGVFHLKILFPFYCDYRQEHTVYCAHCVQRVRSL